MKAYGNKKARFNGKVIGPFGEFESVKQVSEETGIPYSTSIR